MYFAMFSTAADGTGKSFMVTKPDGALMTLGIELTTIATVPMSPWTQDQNNS